MSPSEAPGGAKQGDEQGQSRALDDDLVPIGHQTPLWHTRWDDSADEVREFVVGDYFKPKRKPSLLQRVGAWLRGVPRRR